MYKKYKYLPAVVLSTIIVVVRFVVVNKSDCALTSSTGDASNNPTVANHAQDETSIAGKIGPKEGQ